MNIMLKSNLFSFEEICLSQNLTPFAFTLLDINETLHHGNTDVGMAWWKCLRLHARDPGLNLIVDKQF